MKRRKERGEERRGVKKKGEKRERRDGEMLYLSPFNKLTVKVPPSRSSLPLFITE